MGAERTGSRISRFLLHVVWPWPAIRRSVRQLASQKQQHKENILYIRNLGSRDKHKINNAVTPSQSFDDMMRNRGAGAPSIPDLEKRFLRQKRLALGTCAIFALVAVCAIASGNLLGIATLLTCLPLFFMACLSAQLRLWQLRTHRLSKDEGGGLRDFMRETDGWYWQALDPEFNSKPREKS